MIKELKKSVFKKNNKKNKYLTIEDYQEIDKTVKMIPLSFKPALFNIYYYKDLIKKILIIMLDLDNDYYNQDLYYGNKILNSKFPSYVKRTSIILTINKDKSIKESFLNLKNSLVWTFVKYDSSDSELYQIILNTNLSDSKSYEKEIVFKDEKSKKTLKGFAIYLKNINYFKKKYYEDEVLKDKDLITIILKAKTFKETYQIISKIFDEKDTEHFMRYVIETSQNIKIKKQYRNAQKSSLKI